MENKQDNVSSSMIHEDSANNEENQHSCETDRLRTWSGIGYITVDIALEPNNVDDSEIYNDKPTNKHLDIVRKRTVSVISQDSFGSVICISIPPETDDVITSGAHDINDAIPPAPDGGWGWVVVVMAFFSFSAIGMAFAGFSVFYVELVDRFQSERGVTGWIGSLYAFTGNFLGVVTGAFIQRYGARIVALSGALLLGAGLGLSAILVNIPYLYFTYGLLAGLGNGMSFAASIIILQKYFDKKRTLALGLASSGLSFGGLISAPLLNFLLDKYGLAGTLLIVAGILLQNIVLGCFYRPVKKHKSHTVKQKDEANSRQDSINEGLGHEKLGNQNNHNSDHKEIFKHNTKSRKCALFFDILDCSPVKNVNFVLLLLGTFLMNFGTMGFMMHYLSRCLYLGMDRELAIIFQTCLSGSIGLGRLLFSFVGNMRCVDRVLLYAILITISGCVVTSLPLAQTDVVNGCFCIVQGLISGGFFSLQPSVIVDVAGVSRIAKLTGFFNMSISVAILTGVPLIGFIFDVSQGYDLPFYVAGSIQLFGGGVLLTLAALHRRNICVHKDRVDH